MGLDTNKMDNFNRIVIYLDHNIFARSVNQLKNIDRIFHKILLALNQSLQVAIPYSSIHIEEVRQISGPYKDNNIQEHLTAIKDISKSYYIDFNVSVNNYTIRQRDPFELYQTITTNDILSYEKIQEGLIKLIPFDKMKEIRERLKIDKKVLSNLDPADAVNYIDQKLEVLHQEMMRSQKGYQSAFESIIGSGEKLTLLTLTEYVSAIAQSCNLNIDQHTKSIMFAQMLESFGYQSNDRNSKRLAVFNDHCHYSFAKIANYFITDDKKLLKKLGGTPWCQKPMKRTESGNWIMNRQSFLSKMENIEGNQYVINLEP